MEWITYTGIIVGSALIAITIDWLVRRRRRKPNCLGLGIAESGHDMLVGLMIGELTQAETINTLSHLQHCPPCAEIFRTVVTLHCGRPESTDGVVYLTPDVLKRLRARASDRVQ